MSDLIPEGWAYKHLGEYIIDSAAGEWGNESQGDDNDIPVLRSTNFTESGVIDYSKLAFRNIDEKKRIKKSLKNGDILLEKSGGSPAQPVGRVVYFDRDTPHLYSNFTQKLVPAETCNNKYLFYKLYFEYQNGTVLKFQQQTTGIINFQLAEYLGFKTTFAPLPEQQKIATILSSVDTVIETTRAQIDKLKDLKTGMMQELLTKGIGVDGVQHTEFKDSPVGRIPAGWEVAGIYDACSEIFLGLTAKVDYVDSGGAYLVRATDISGGVLSFANARKITVDQHKSLTKLRRAKCGDILVSKSGSLGVCAIVETDMEFSIYESIIVLQPKLDVVDPKFLLWLMRSTEMQTRLLGGTVGSTVGHLNLSDFRKLQLPLPPLIEQTRLGEVLDSLHQKQCTAQSKLQCVQHLKKALMQDLLTGKVRVGIDENKKEPEAA